MIRYWPKIIGLSLILAAAYCSAEANAAWEVAAAVVGASLLWLPKDTRCYLCGQVDHGQTGEYPCPSCGLPRMHDA